MGQRTQDLFVKVWRAIVSTSILIVALTAILWTFDNESPVNIISASLEDTEVAPGGFLHINYEIDQKRICPGDLQRMIVDGRNVLHFIEPYYFSQTGKGTTLGNQHVGLSIPIPVGASPGDGRYQAIIRYYCNPLQRFLNRAIEIETPPLDFKIKAVTPPLILREPSDMEVITPEPMRMRSANLNNIVFASYAPPFGLPRSEVISPLGGCARGFVSVKSHMRRVGEKLIYIKEYCRRSG